MGTEFIKSFLSNTNKYHKSSGYAPLLYLCLIVFSSSVTVIIYCNNQTIQYSAGFICIILIFISIITYFYLLVKNPKELHTETYLLEDKKLDIMARQGENPKELDYKNAVEPQNNLLRE